ncbi:hypothetical protein [Streptomyces sp. ME19-01-6]|uniref:hypothetical protein n=1 Tax=Streptomyces sp. ME19-01-6 TaxID=3028686 RepID=UPI0029A9A833|nr:hypothetical protein [Streptomyces sp. ME19-01-6]MDX3226151.1 hypothetical protein [Streptomyces sp. ME19-01-6]
MPAPTEIPWNHARAVEVRDLNADGETVIRDPVELAELARLLEVDHAGAGFVCMCWGDVEFRVRDAAQRTLAVLRLHLGSGLDWHEWAGQLPLLRAEDLTRWLTDRGLCATPPAPRL